MSFVPPAKFVKGIIMGNAIEPISDSTVKVDPELLRYWRTFPAPSNEVLACDLIESLQRELASLADELRLAREDAARYRWLQDWYLREGKRSEIDEFGHIRQTTALIMDAAIDAALKEPR